MAWARGRGLVVDSKSLPSRSRPRVGLRTGPAWGWVGGAPGGAMAGGARSLPPPPLAAATLAHGTRRPPSLCVQGRERAPSPLTRASAHARGWGARGAAAAPLGKRPARQRAAGMAVVAQVGRALLAPFAGAAHWYNRAAQRRPFLVGVVTTGVKTSAADMFAQKVCVRGCARCVCEHACRARAACARPPPTHPAPSPACPRRWWRGGRRWTGRGTPSFAPLAFATWVPFSTGSTTSSSRRCALGVWGGWGGGVWGCAEERLHCTLARSHPPTHPPTHPVVRHADQDVWAPRHRAHQDLYRPGHPPPLHLLSRFLFDEGPGQRQASQQRG